MFKPDLILDAHHRGYIKPHPQFFGVHTVQTITDPQGNTAYKLNGTTNNEDWCDPRYTQFVGLVCRLNVDNFAFSLYGTAQTLICKQDFQYFFYWNEDYYVLGRNRNDQAIKKASGQLLQMVLYKLEPGIIRDFIAHIHTSATPSR